MKRSALAAKGALLGAALALGLAGCVTPHLEVDDAVAFEDGRTRFAAFAERDEGPFFGGVEGVEVRFRVDGETVATALSDDRGVATVLANIEPGRRRFEASASYGGRSFQRAGKIVRWRSDQVVVACDIDATISDTALGALFFDETDEKSQPIEGSAEVLREIAKRHGVVYFTARPKFTLEKTQRWLEAHGYPEGPVLTSLTVGDLIAQARYKRRELGKLREIFPNLLIGIGNSHADSEGYGANGILALIVNRKRDPKYGRHEIEFEGWEEIGRFFEANRELLQDADRLRAAARGEGMLVVPTLQFPSPGSGEEGG
jgi:hypothetical protein